MKRKLNAFTLAEVLITLGILGVIAMTVLPAVNANVVSAQLGTALKTTQASISDKLDAAMALEDVNDIRDLKAFEANNRNDLYEGLEKYLRLDRVSDNHPIRSLSDGSVVATWPAADIRQTNTKAYIYISDFTESRPQGEGAITAIKNAGGAILRRNAIVFIDANGYTKPNRLGYDVFQYYLAQNGRLYPVGGSDVSLFQTAGASSSNADWSSNNENFKCDRASDGYGCAGRVEAENWKLTYLSGKKASTASSKAEGESTKGDSSTTGGTN